MESMNIVPQYWLTRFCFQRALGFVYFIAFLIVVNQFHPLLGSRGLLPARLFLKRVEFWETPSLFWFNCSDSFISVVGWIGLFLSVLAVTGLSDRFGIFFSVTVWALLWLFYLSFVNLGQVFYGFGWETLLLETGFLAIFFGSSDMAPPKIIIWLLRWVLFRIILGAGLIKIRGDECWRNLTCMYYHYETQPLPNPLSWYFHWLPRWFHRLETLSTHFVELIVPWGVFIPSSLIAASAGALIAVFQILLIFSGNLSWLNYITLVLCIPCFDDRILSRIIPIQIPSVTPIPGVYQSILILLTGLILLLSILPAINLFSRRQMMNASFEPLHIVNTYGAFGSVTKQRTEIIIEGTDDSVITSATQWRAYEFKGKPGNVSRAPCIVSPYHWKLDWQMWFAAMTDYLYHPWILNLVAKLLEGDQAALSLIADNPFPEDPPKYIRAELYLYQFTNSKEKRKTGNWWKRSYVRQYLPPLSLHSYAFRELLREQGWLDESA